MSITVSVGRLSGVVADALQFGFKMARQDTMLDDTELIIREVPVVVWCTDGDHLVELSEMILRCPEHGCSTPDIRSGKEMQIMEIEIPDEVEPTVQDASR